MSAAGPSSVGSVPPSVVINEPRDEALIKWLKECRIDSDSIEKVSCCVIHVILYKAFQVHVCVNSELRGSLSAVEEGPPQQKICSLSGIGS